MHHPIRLLVLVTLACLAAPGRAHAESRASELALLGTIARIDARKNAALIALPGQPAQVYALGSAVGATWVLVRVEPAWARLEDSRGNGVTLRLGDRAAQTPERQAQPVVAPSRPPDAEAVSRAQREYGLPASD